MVVAIATSRLVDQATPRVMPSMKLWSPSESKFSHPIVCEMNESEPIPEKVLRGQSQGTGIVNRERSEPRDRNSE